MKIRKPYRKKALLDALKKCGMPYTAANFIVKYENTICTVEHCPHKGQPYLISPRNKNYEREYYLDEVRQIVSVAKRGWFNCPRHFHWWRGIKGKKTI